MRGKRQLDLNRDPAPDLIIEVDVTRTSLDRLKIFAALGVPEVWRSTGRSLQFLHLQADGTYQARTTSRNFPTLHGLIGRSIPQARADRRFDGLDPVIPGFRHREARSRPGSERTLRSRKFDPPPSTGAARTQAQSRQKRGFAPSPSTVKRASKTSVTVDLGTGSENKYSKIELDPTR